MNGLLQRFVPILIAVSLSGAATLPYQGLATDAKGNPRADGTAAVAFSLYTASSGGTAAWTESQTLTTKKGLFSVSLGSGTAIPDSLFDGRALWLGVALDGAAEASPRLQLGSVPYANGAGKADTARASRYADTAKVALHVVGADSALIYRDSASAKTARDSVALLTVRVKADSASLKTVRDSIQTLTATLTALSLTVQDLSLLSISSNSSIHWNSSISYGTLTDSRDGQTYRTVKIGTQRWMAQNLNYRSTADYRDTMATGDTVGMWYKNSPDSGAKYGRLYTWSEAMAGHDSSSANPSGVQGVCPTGWHVPSDTEWTILFTYIGGEDSAGAKLKSTRGWTDPSTRTPAGSGTDTYGFRLLPASDRYDDEKNAVIYFDDPAYNSYFWTASKFGSGYSKTQVGGIKIEYFYESRAGVSRIYDPSYHKSSYSLRCVED